MGVHFIGGWRILLIIPMTAPYATAEGGEAGAAGYYIAASRDVAGVDPLTRVFITARVHHLTDDVSNWREVSPMRTEEHAMASVLLDAGWSGLERAMGLLAQTR